jgi:hypothetical protein
MRFIELLESLDQSKLRIFNFQEVKELFMREIGVFDRTSLLAYFGRQKQTLTKTIRMTKTYQASGTRAARDITLKTDVSCKKGYFEILGLAEIVQTPKAGLMFALTEKALVPDLKVNYSSPSPTPFNDRSLGNGHVGAVEPCADFSLSHNMVLAKAEELDAEIEKDVESREERESVYCEREKSDNIVIEKSRKTVTVDPEAERFLAAIMLKEGGH